MLYVIVGLLLINRQLLSPILQTEHAQMIIESLLIYAVLALYLSVVARRSDTDAVVDDVVLLQLYLKQALILRII